MASKYKSTENLIGHPNVRVSNDRIPTSSPLETDNLLFQVLRPLIDLKPNWRFDAWDFLTQYETTTPTGATKSYLVTSFVIFENDERLGEVSAGSHGYKGLHKVAVDSPRISANKLRGGPYRTDNPEKARLAIRKYFYAADAPMLLDQSLEETSSTLSSLEHSHEMTARRARHTFLSKADEFVRKHVDMYTTEMGTLAQYEDMCEKQRMYDVIQTLHKAREDANCTLVIVKEGEYIKAIQSVAGDRNYELTKLASSELSFDIRKALGMLQLVEPRQAISDIGLRVSTNVFLLLGRLA
jgi:hypothetical protein